MTSCLEKVKSHYMFNEGGSKRLGTLEVSGAPVVKLKENHAATRERVTLMTTTTSNPDVASSYRNMPLELLCKAKSPRRIRDLVVPRGMRMSFAWAQKGSYRNEHILAANDAAAAWRVYDHWKGAKGHKLTGLSNSLDGSEDHLIAREAAQPWTALDIPSERLRAMERLTSSLLRALCARWTTGNA